MSSPASFEHLPGGLRPELGPKARVLHVDGETVYASRGLELLLSQDGGRRFEVLGRAPGGLLARQLASIELCARVLRSGFHGLVPLPDGALLAVVRGAVLRKEPDSTRFEVVHEVQRGSRPLNLCCLPNGHVYFGEYFSNRRREEVLSYGSEDGRSFDVVGGFLAGNVRHVHGIHHDPHRGGMWVLTGDEDQESGLWWTDDEFSTLEPVWQGLQSVRAVTLFAESWGLVVPMDSPRELNYIQHLDPQPGAIERLAPLPGSAFHGTRTEKLWLVSTAVERSPVNAAQRPALFASENGTDWSPVAWLERDQPPFARDHSLFQWPTLVLPSGRASGGRVLGSVGALAGAHDRLLSWSEAEILEHLRSDGAKHSA